MEAEIKGRVRTQKPAAFTAGAYAPVSLDNQARQVMTPYQARDALATAYASTSTLAEVALLAGEAGVFNEPLELTCANTTGAAVTLHIRCGTGGNIAKTVQIAANANQEITFPAPYPMTEVAQAWTIQNGGSGDISNTVITVSGVFVKNI